MTRPQTQEKSDSGEKHPLFKDYLDEKRKSLLDKVIHAGEICGFVQRCDLHPCKHFVLFDSLALVSSTKVQQCQGIAYDPISQAILLIPSRFPSLALFLGQRLKLEMSIIKVMNSKKTGVQVRLKQRRLCIKRGVYELACISSPLLVVVEAAVAVQQLLESCWD